MSEATDKLLLGILTKYFNKTEDEIGELIYDTDDDGVKTLKDSADDVLLGLDATRIARIRKEIGDQNAGKFDDFAKKTKKEVLSKLEGELKTQYGVESTKTGVELIAEIVEASGKGTGDITEESLKTNPIFLKIEKAMKEEADGKYVKLSGEFDEYKGGIAKRMVMSQIKGRAREEFLKLNPALSETQAIADNQVTDFLDKFDTFEFDVVDDAIIIKSGDGRLEDGHGNPIAFDAFVKREAEKRFDLNKQADRSSSGNTSGGGGAGKVKITEKEYNNKMASAHTDEDIMDISNKFEVIVD